MATSPIRYKRLIHNIPLYNNATDALLASGFSKNTSRTQQKRVMQSAMKHQARELLKGIDETINSKDLMEDIVGMSKEEVFMLIRKIANQDKDYSSALKALSPISKHFGYPLTNDEDNKQVNVPILNLSFGSQVIKETNEIKPYSKALQAPTTEVIKEDDTSIK